MSPTQILRLFLTIPLLPLLGIQGRRLRADIPELPPAANPTGYTGDKSANPLRLLILGESTMAGLGVTDHRQAFAGRVAERLHGALLRPIQWQVIAKSGYTAKKVSARLLPLAVDVPSDLILIGLGANDSFVFNYKWADDISALITTLKTSHPKVPIVFINLPPVADFPALTRSLRFSLGNFMDILRTQMIDIAAMTEDCYFIDEKITLKGWTEKYQLEGSVKDYFSDGIHPSALTYDLWAREAVDFICHKVPPYCL